MKSRAAGDPGPLTREVADLLRARRARTRTPLADLAVAVDISQAQLGKVLAGTKPISLDLFDRLCQAMGASAVDFLTEAVETVPDRWSGADAIQNVTDADAAESAAVEEDVLWDLRAARRQQLQDADDHDLLAVASDPGHPPEDEPEHFGA